jgi:N,N'-diacetyllegionaminate synthase
MTGPITSAAGTLKIGTRPIGPSHPAFIIAEAGVNHNGDLVLARQLVDAAAEAGADAVKFQTFTAKKLVTPQAVKADYQRQTTDASESQYAMLKRLELPQAAFRELYAYCQARNILFLSTPFEEESADFLETLGVAAFKMASGEITNLPFLAHVARKGLPMIVSTGMATLGEVETAVRTIRDAGSPDLALLHCVSQYPADPADVNLRAMHTLETAFGVPVGYSDHTLGLEVPLAAVALGASIIEKHFTLDRTLPGPDHRASLEPPQLRALVQGIRKVESALGQGGKVPARAEANTAAAARKSLVAACDLPIGTVLTEAHIAIRRPGTGLPPNLRSFLIGRVTRTAIAEGALFSLEMLA